MSIRKISNKSLSRNLKTRKVPLRVLPLAPFHKRYRLNQTIQKKEKHQGRIQQTVTSTVHCEVEKVTRTIGKSVKKTGEKKPLRIKPILSFHGKMNTLRWILPLIFVYIVIGTVVVMVQEGTEPLKNIIIYSIMGFFTFFMGYLGWILAQDVLDIVSGKKNHNEAELEA